MPFHHLSINRYIIVKLQNKRTNEISSWGWIILLDAPVVLINVTFWGESEVDEEFVVPELDVVVATLKL